MNAINEIMPEVLEALEAAGLVTVTEDTDGSLLVAPTAKFTTMVDERGIGLADISRY